MEEKMLTIDLFTWWALSISWSIVFLIVAGFYLYASSRPKPKEKVPVGKRKRFNEAGTYSVLASISIVGALMQTLWWLLPGCMFLLLAIFAAIERQHEQWRGVRLEAEAMAISKNFIFVWILLGLLVFYIFSVQLGTGQLSELVFGLGNIFVEILLVVYLFRNRDKNAHSR
jgi:hypothetical protein